MKSEDELPILARAACSSASRSSSPCDSVHELSLQLMESCRPYIGSQFDKLMQMNEAEPYFITRVLELLSSFNNGYSRQRLLLVLEELVDTMRQKPDIKTLIQSIRDKNEPPSLESMNLIIQKVVHESQFFTPQHQEQISSALMQIIEPVETASFPKNVFLSAADGILGKHIGEIVHDDAIYTLSADLSYLCKLWLPNQSRYRTESITDMITSNLEDMQLMQESLSKKLRRLEQERRQIMKMK